MKIPSKELLSEVLRMEIISLRIAGNFIMFNVYTPLGKDERGINIYELMHLMKEFALNSQYIIRSSYDGCATIDGVTDTEWFDDTELEAVTKACEYILEQTNEPK